MHRLAVSTLVALVACREDKLSLPKVDPGSGDPVLPSTAPVPQKIDTSTLSGRLRDLFGTTQSPDVAGSIAKLEAQRAAMPDAEKQLVDRAIALLRSGDAAMKEPDRAKARPLQIQMVRDTLALLEDMSAASPDDLDLQGMVAGSLTILSTQVESLEITAEVSTRQIKERARAIAKHLIEVHPSSAKAWAIHAAMTPYTDRETRLRSFAKCVQLEPSNAVCKSTLESERAEYVRPYCEPADFKGDISWRVATKTPTPGWRQVVEHYETLYLAPTPKFTLKDVIGIRASVTREDHEASDGKRTTRYLDGVDFELTPATHEAMVAWSRELESRRERRATMQGDELLFTDSRAMWEDSMPGVAGLPIAKLCAKTKQRALPE